MSSTLYNNNAVKVFNSIFCISENNREQENGIKNIPRSIEKIPASFHRKNPRVAAHKTVVVKLHSNVHARVQAFHEYLNEKKKYRQCVDGRDYKLCRKADSLAVKMFRSGY